MLLFVGKSIVKWCNGHHPELEEPTRASEEPNRASVSEVVSNMTTTTTTSPLVSPAYIFSWLNALH